MVEYRSLKTKSETSLREIVDLQYIRPCPPDSPEDRNFSLYDVVEAFYNSGWCRGVVSRMHARSIYSIKFMHLEDELEFSHAELRLPYDWDDGKWVLASQDKSTRQSSSGTDSVNHEQYSYASSVVDKSKGPCPGTALNFEGDEALCKSRIYAMNLENQKIARSKFRSQLESSQPPKKRKNKEEAIEDNGKLLDFLVMARGTKTPSRVGVGSDVTTPAAKERPSFHFRSFIIDRFGYSTNALKDNNMAGPDFMTPPCTSTLLEGADHETPVPANNGQESLRTTLGISGLSNKREEFGKQGEAGSKNQSETPHLCCVSSTKGTECTQYPLMNNQQKKKKLASKHQQDKLPNDNGARQLTAGENRRKRVRPQKIKLLDRYVSLQGHKVKQSEGSNHVTIVSEQHGNVVAASAIVDSSSITCDIQPPCHGSKERSNEHSPSALDSQGTLMRENVSNIADARQDKKVVSEQFLEGHSMPQLEVMTQHDRTEALAAQEPLNLATGSSNGWLLEAPNSCIPHREAGCEAQNGVLASPLSDQGDKRGPVREAEAVTGPTPCKSPSKKLCLPFEKQSSLWESFESMEIFSAMPQPPHFRPLVQYCKGLREGMAIGLMVTFCNLLGRIGKLQITDSQSRFDVELKTLAHLEEHGFNVQDVRTCLKELLRMKDNQEQLVEKKSALEVIILEKQKKNDDLNSKIQEIDKAVMNLEQTLTQFQQKRASVLKLKEDNDSELVKLQMDARSAEQVLASIKHDFEGIRAAPW